MLLLSYIYNQGLKNGTFFGFAVRKGILSAVLSANKLFIYILLLSDSECSESCSVIMNFASALDQEVFSNEEDGSVTFYN